MPRSRARRRRPPRSSRRSHRLRRRPPRPPRRRPRTEMARAKDADEEAASDTPEDDVQMGFLEHIGELRKRLIYSMLGVIPGITVAWIFKEQLMAMLAHPLAVAWRKLGLGAPKLHFANPMDGFVAYMQIALV